MPTDADLYERFVKELFLRNLGVSPWQAPIAVTHREKFIGRKTGNPHEIDLACRTQIAGMDILIVIECKHYRRRVGKEIIEQLRSIMDDIGAHKGVIVTTVGFQKGALRAAHAHGIALIIAAIEKKWLEQPDDNDLFTREWNFMNHGACPMPFAGPRPIACAHHAEWFVSSLVSGLQGESQRIGPPWCVDPHLPVDVRYLLEEEGFLDRNGHYLND